MSAQHAGTFTIVNPLGMHARAATKLVQLAGRFVAEVFVERDGQKANAKSVMGVLLLCAGPGVSITVRADGPDATEAVTAIGELVSSGFGELR